MSSRNHDELVKVHEDNYSFTLDEELYIQLTLFDAEGPHKRRRPPIQSETHDLLQVTTVKCTTCNDEVLHRTERIIPKKGTRVRQPKEVRPHKCRFCNKTFRYPLGKIIHEGTHLDCGPKAQIVLFRSPVKGAT